MEPTIERVHELLEFIRPEFGSNDLGLGMSCSRVNKLMNFYRNKKSSSLTAVNIIFHNLMILLRDFLPEGRARTKKKGPTSDNAQDTRGTCFGGDA